MCRNIYIYTHTHVYITEYADLYSVKPSNDGLLFQTQSKDRDTASCSAAATISWEHSAAKQQPCHPNLLFHPPKNLEHCYDQTIKWIWYRFIKEILLKFPWHPWIFGSLCYFDISRGAPCYPKASLGRRSELGATSAVHTATASTQGVGFLQLDAVG